MRRLLPLLIFALAAAGPAASQRAPGSDDLARLQAEYRDETVRARRLRADARAAAAEIAGLEQRLAALRGEVEDGDVRLAGQRDRLRALNAREAALTAELTRERGRAGRLLTALQMMGRRPPPPLLIPAARATETVRAAILLEATAPVVQARVARLTERQGELARVRREALLASEALIAGESEQGDRRAELESALARKKVLEASLRAEAESAERAARALDARIRTLGGTVPTVSEPARASSRQPGGRDSLTPPASGRPIQRFGGRSAGLRWAAPAATARAPAAGRVLHAGPLSGWGEVVILDIGPGWRAVVAGMDSLDVTVGQTVADGQALGRTDADGEIYLELRRDEQPVDPAPWLPVN